MPDAPTSEHNIPDEYLREIGRVAVEWSRVEAAIEAMIWAFMFVDQGCPSPWMRENDGRAVTTHVNFLLRLDIVLSLASQCPGNRMYQPKDHKMSLWSLGPFNSAPLEMLIRWLREAYTKRNRIVHGNWAMAGNKSIRQTFRARGDITPFYEIQTATQIANIADEIALLASNTEDLCAALVRYLCAEDNWSGMPIFPTPIP